MDNIYIITTINKNDIKKYAKIALKNKLHYNKEEGSGTLEYRLKNPKCIDELVLIIFENKYIGIAVKFVTIPIYNRIDNLIMLYIKIEYRNKGLSKLLLNSFSIPSNELTVIKNNCTRYISNVQILDPSIYFGILQFIEIETLLGYTLDKKQMLANKILELNNNQKFILYLDNKCIFVLITNDKKIYHLKFIRNMLLVIHVYLDFNFIKHNINDIRILKWRKSFTQLGVIRHIDFLLKEHLFLVY